jgi:hypothetical protein
MSEDPLRNPWLIPGLRNQSNTRYGLGTSLFLSLQGWRILTALLGSAGTDQ